MDKKEQNRKRNAEWYERLRKDPEKAKEFYKEKYLKSSRSKKTLGQNGTFPNNNCLNPESCFNYKTYQYLKGKYPWMNLAVPVEMDGPLPEPRSIDVVIANILRFPPIL